MTRAPSLTLGGRYQLVERLALGGMGEVWQAEDLVLGRSVAVKVLREEHAHDPTFRRRFREEAQHAALLVHPNVAQVFDFGEGDDESGEPPYLVMELIRGEPLSAVLERDGRLDAERTFSIMGQASSALAAAHEAGVVHRDIKPANLLICPDGTLKVTDFGIARATGSSAVTTAGYMLGTPHYVSPEQVNGETLTGATDFYALGVVAYECLTGVRLFDGDPMTVLVAHRDQEPPPLPPGVPAGLAGLVTAMLDKDPAKRPTDGRAIAAQAERFNAPTVSLPIVTEAYPSEPAPAKPRQPAAPTAITPTTGVLPAADEPAPRPRRTPLLLGIAAAVLAVGVIAAVVLMTRGSSPAQKHTTAPAPAKPTTVRVASVQPYAGAGGSADHPEEASLADDGNPSTSWYTQHYASASFGNLRNGAGLLFDLGRPVAVKTLTLRLSVPGVAVQVRAANSTGSIMSAQKVGGAANAPSQLSLHPTTTARYWLVWFTQLAPNDGAYRAGVAEASFAH